MTKMISLIHRKKTRDKKGKKSGYGLIATEELLFWGGLGALAFSSGWIAVFGGVALCTSIVMVVYLFVYS